VHLVASKPVQIAPSEELTGTLVPSKALQLAFEVGGRLESVKVQKGQHIDRGQILATLNTEVADAQVKGAEAAVQAAEVQAENAADVAARTNKLKEGGSASELQNRSSAAQAKAAEAQLLAAKAQLEQAQAARNRHVLRAPFAATVIDAPEQVGSTVAPGLPLFSLEQLDPLVLKVTVPESALGQLRAGQEIKVESVAGRAHTEHASVKVVLPSAEQNTHRVPVELSVPNGDGSFLAHALARAHLELGPVADARQLPASAVVLAGGDHVLVLGSDGKIQRVDVQVVERGAENVTVRSNSAATALDKVIDAPGLNLNVGDQAAAN
jgi:RND family efflux transporter MFP subunit